LRAAEYGHNGGLCGALPGPSFIINTSEKVFSVRANKPLDPGRHYLVGVYDGAKLSLYFDGELAAEQRGRGRIQSNDTDITVGRILNGLGELRGTVHEVRISTVARDPGWIRTEFRNQKDPDSFYRILPEEAIQ